MQSIFLIIASACLVIDTIVAIIFSTFYIKNNKQEFVPGNSISETAVNDNTNAIQDEVMTSVLDELFKYCDSKGLKNVFVDSSTDQLALSYNDDKDNIVRILELKFPDDNIGSQEYLTCVESQKEEIDNFIRGKDAKTE